MTLLYLFKNFLAFAKHIHIYTHMHNSYMHTYIYMNLFRNDSLSIMTDSALPFPFYLPLSFFFTVIEPLQLMPSLCLCLASPYPRWEKKSDQGLRTHRESQRSEPKGSQPSAQGQVDVPLCISVGSGVNGMAFSSLPHMERGSPPCNTACV